MNPIVQIFALLIAFLLQIVWLVLLTITLMLVFLVFADDIELAFYPMTSMMEWVKE